MRQELLIKQLKRYRLGTAVAETLLAELRAALQARDDDRELILAKLQEPSA